MGENVNGKSGQLAQPPKGSTDPRTAGGNPVDGTRRNSSSPAPAPRTAATAAGSGNRTAGSGKAEEKKPAGLATVNPVAKAPAAPAPEEPKKKQQRKPRKKKEEAQNFNADQISALILSATSIVASRPDMQVWQISPDEANQLATPIANMIAKSEKLQNMGEYADAISLVTASLIIFAPRAMVYHEQKKQKKIQQTGGVKIARKDETRKVQGSDGKPDGVNAAPVPKHDTSFLDAVPAISW